MTSTAALSVMLMQVSSISEDEQQSSSAQASTSYSSASPAAKQQVHVKLPGNIKKTIPADMVLWTAGSSPASHAARKLKLPFETNQKEHC